MKATNRFIKVKTIATGFLFFVLSCIITGCGSPLTAVQADVGLKRSETEYGGGVTALVGKQLSNEKTSVYGLAGYHLYSFDGGHDNLFQLGVQGRQTIGEEELFFAGGEAGWLNDKSVYKEAEWGNPTSNGFFIGALGGYKLPVSALDISVFTGLNYMSLGDFKADDYVIESGHNSIQFKLGVEFTFHFWE